jgi:hypothetical protein
MRSRIIDGEDWLAKRLAYLRQRLSEDVTAEDRQAIENEIEVLSHEVGFGMGGLPTPRFLLRRLRRRRRKES